MASECSVFQSAACSEPAKVRSTGYVQAAVRGEAKGTKGRRGRERSEGKEGGDEWRREAGSEIGEEVWEVR